MSAAPLKHGAEELALGGFAESPHSHECGPVEAASPHGLSDSHLQCLRTLMSAAPLKRPRKSLLVTSRWRCLRTLMSAAPLKHLADVGLLIGIPGVSALS